MANFPTSIFSPRALIDRAGIVYNALKTTVLFAKDLNDLSGEVVAIENYLEPLIPVLSAVKVRKVYNLSSQIDGAGKTFLLPASPISGSSVLFYSSAPYVMIEPDYTITSLSLILSVDAPVPEVGQTLILICEITPTS